MSISNREANRAYQREYNRKNPEKRSGWSKAHRDKRAEDPEREADYRACTKSWREENKVHVKTWQKLDRIAKIEKLDEMKRERGCSTCGETHPGCLDFHHRDGTEKIEAVATMVGSRGWKSILTEIEKCDVICSNCHRKLHWEEKRQQREEKFSTLVASLKVELRRQERNDLPSLVTERKKSL